MAATNKPKACTPMEQDLVLYYYSELEAAERDRVEAHTQRCEGCRASLVEMQALLPLTGIADEPPEAFWSAYAREVRHKLSDLEDRKPWWRRLGDLPRSWAFPAFAASAVIAVAIVFTLGKGWLGPSDVPVTDQALMEELPVTENLDFFSHMELLDTIELLESSGTSNGQV